ncbi:hypothetical protein FGO68_gene1902 [Halteria grandinella]|uniref:Uncharacterized protein n=1 Tax=Halteria grandinella TaxID=5974 RepID=A0A8J8NVF1_HALGN|nr:hypothetical protein FGO68_gene1902 [Halteria grandinella]
MQGYSRGQYLNPGPLWSLVKDSHLAALQTDTSNHQYLSTSLTLDAQSSSSGFCGCSITGLIPCSARNSSILSVLKVLMLVSALITSALSMDINCPSLQQKSSQISQKAILGSPPTQLICTCFGYATGARLCSQAFTAGRRFRAQPEQDLIIARFSSRAPRVRVSQSWAKTERARVKRSRRMFNFIFNIILQSNHHSIFLLHQCFLLLALLLYLLFNHFLNNASGRKQEEEALTAYLYDAPRVQGHGLVFQVIGLSVYVDGVLLTEALNLKALLFKVESNQSMLARDLPKMTQVHINMPDYFHVQVLLFVVDR